MTKTDILLILLLILGISVATIHMVNRAIQVDNVKKLQEKNLEL